MSVTQKLVGQSYNHTLCRCGTWRATRLQQAKDSWLHLKIVCGAKASHVGHSAQCTNTNSVCVPVVQVFPSTHLWLMHAKAPIGQLPAKPAGWGGKIWGLGGRQLGLGASKHKSKYNLPQACKSKYAGPHVVKYGSARAVHYMLIRPLALKILLL